jgi:hypothetical protein
LQLLLTTEGRAIFGAAITPPAAISAAVAAIDPPPVRKLPSPYANPWTGLFQALLEDAEAEIAP